MKTLYTAHVTSVGGREGKINSDDGVLSLQLVGPGKKGGTNPEQLFAAGYSACFGSALALCAKQQNITLTEPKVQADVNLNEDSGAYSISAVLNISLPGLDKSAAESLARAAHQICPYSKATRGNIKVDLKVNDQPLAMAA